MTRFSPAQLSANKAKADKKDYERKLAKFIKNRSEQAKNNPPTNIINAIKNYNEAVVLDSIEKNKI